MSLVATRLIGDQSSKTNMHFHLNVIAPSAFKTHFLPRFSNVDLKYMLVDSGNGHCMQGYYLFLNRDQEIPFDG
jgi:hypothetical protein